MATGLCPNPSPKISKPISQPAAMPSSTNSTPYPTATHPIRLLLLETDVLPATHTHTRPSSAFHKLLTRCGAAQNPPIVVSLKPDYVVDHGWEAKLPAHSVLRSHEGVLLTGSKHDAHGNEPWIQRLLEWLETAWQEYPHVRFSGVCFGHQILARMLGGEVERHEDSAWELARTDIELTRIGSGLFKRDEEGEEGKRLVLHQVHQDLVTAVPHAPGQEPPWNGRFERREAYEELKDSQEEEEEEEKEEWKESKVLNADEVVHIWGSSQYCAVQGLYIRKRLLTTQGHLGSDEAMVREAIEHAQESGSLAKGDDEGAGVERKKEEAELEHDGDIVGGAVVRFMAGWDDDLV